MYNWNLVSEHYHEFAENEGSEIYKDHEFRLLFNSHVGDFLGIIQVINNTSVMNALSIKGLPRNKQIGESLSALMLGLHVYVNCEDHCKPGVDSLKHALGDFTAAAKEDKIESYSQACVENIVHKLLRNLPDILSEFVHVQVHAQDEGYVASMQIMYLTGAFIGHSLLWAKNEPDGLTQLENNIFSAYTEFLESELSNLKMLGE